MNKLSKMAAIKCPNFKTLTLKSIIRTLTTSSSSSSSSFSLKNVTKSNFNETLETLKAHIKLADFIAIDIEMTGITTAPWRESFEFDRHDVRYLKVKDSAHNFAVVQFGVCPFRWDSLTMSFVSHPHNFYIFPRQELPADGPSYEFLCQTSSIDFLAKYQFDFNACIREGVSYLSRGQEDEALRRLNSVYDGTWYRMDEVRDIPLVTVADILFTERMKIRLSEWHDSLLQKRSSEFQLHGNAAESKQRFETIFFNMRPALKLNGFTSRQLNLIELVVRKHVKDLIYVRAYDECSNLQKLIVYTDSENDKRKLIEEVKHGLHQQARRKVKEAVGFRHVIDLLSDEKKLIVGHNCFLDLAHVYHKFFGPLPSNVQEFVSNIHNTFPHIIDTKILLNTNKDLQKLMKKTSTSLASAFSLLCPEIASRRSSSLGLKQCIKVEVHVDDMRSTNWNSGAKHEAGYDAFMTGCVFAQACSHLGVDFLTENLANSEKLRNYINLLYLSWSSGDAINVSTGDTIEFSSINSGKRRLLKILHSNIVLIWGFARKLKANEIRECICKVFGANSVACAYNLDESAIFVQFNKPELVTAFLKLKERLETSDDSISIVHPFSKLLEGGKTCAAGYEIYKDICSSPISKVLFDEQAEAVGINWRTKLISEVELLGPNEEQSTGKSTSPTSASDDGEVDEWKQDFQMSKPRQSVFDRLLYEEPSREMKVNNKIRIL